MMQMGRMPDIEWAEGWSPERVEREKGYKNVVFGLKRRTRHTGMLELGQVVRRRDTGPVTRCTARAVHAWVGPSADLGRGAQCFGPEHLVRMVVDLDEFFADFFRQRFKVAGKSYRVIARGPGVERYQDNPEGLLLKLRRQRRKERR